MKHLTQLVVRHKQGEANGIYAVCSAHPLVLESAIRFAQANHTPLLVEATSNQVDQFGGYTGMTPLISAALSIILPIHWGSPATGSSSAAIIWGQTAGNIFRSHKPWPTPTI